MLSRKVLKKSLENEKTSEKALIPLPPTGFASFFCVKPDVVQTNPQPRQTKGPHRRFAISQIAKFRREMQRACTEAHQAVISAAQLESPNSLGGKFQSVQMRRFSKA